MLPTRDIPIRRKVLYLTVLVVLTLAMCEGVVRMRAWIRYGSAAPALRDPMLTYDPAADLNVPTPGYEVKGAKIHIKINTLGFRGNEFTRDKPPGVVRIVCLGASTTFGAEASSNAAVWTAQLEQKLQAAYPNVKIEVINAAVAGYTSTENLKNLRHRVLPLRPDLVIYYEANNEIARDTRELAVRDGISSGQAQSSAAIRTLSRYSLLFDLVAKNLTIITRSRSQSEQKLDQIPTDTPRRFVGVLDQMRVDLATQHVPLMLSTFIVKYRRSQDRATQIANADVAFYYMPWLSIDGLLNAVDIYNSAILAYAAQAGLPVVDDRDAIPADTTHFVDCMHLADAGHALMADRFFRHLQDSGLMGRLTRREKD